MAERERQEVERKSVLEAERAELNRLRAEESENLRKLDYLQKLDPREFEEIVLQAYRNLGWDATSTKVSGDEGVDGFLRRDGATLILQCKRFTSRRVGSPVLRDLLGTVVKERASGGILVTTSFFSDDAIEWARGISTLMLMDGLGVVRLMSQAFPEGSLVPEDFITRRKHLSLVPPVCPWCGKKVKRRNGKYGKFIGCAGFPACRWTMPAPFGKKFRRSS